MEGIILRGIGSFYTVADEYGVEYTLRAQKKLRRSGMTPAVGDRVVFEPGQGEEDGWILSILPRKSWIERPSVANADVLMLVVAPQPKPDLLLIDRLMLRASSGGMTPAIIVNKTDLSADLFAQLERDYRGTALRLFAVSAHSGEGLEALSDFMRGRVVCLAGQSAVGKSSLINALLGLTLETGGLSRKTERGRHTTRRCELLSKNGLYLVDTPGFSLLELEDRLSPEALAEHYEEYAALAGQCRFSPCLHDREPGCAVAKAVEGGTLSAERWTRYKALLLEAREMQRRKYQ